MDDQIAVAFVVFAVLFMAAVSDWRKREASDLHWLIIMGIGAVLFGIRVHDADLSPMCYLSVVSMVLMAADLLWDRDTDNRIDLALYFLIIVSVVVSAFAMRDDDLLWTYLSIPAMYLLMNFLYYSGAVKGGADAKALISIAFAYPSYPVFGNIPFIGIPGDDAVYFIVPAFSVFLFAALFTVLLVIPYAVTNIVRGDISFPEMFAGYRMDIGRAEKAQVWPMDDVVNGQIISSVSGVEDESVFERLRAAGAERIWVTPVIPFLIPITAAFAVVIFLGNPLLLLI